MALNNHPRENCIFKIHFSMKLGHFRQNSEMSPKMIFFLKNINFEKKCKIAKNTVLFDKMHFYLKIWYFRIWYFLPIAES